jgi:hypothetical protein
MPHWFFQMHLKNAYNSTIKLVLNKLLAEKKEALFQCKHLSECKYFIISSDRHYKHFSELMTPASQKYCFNVVEPRNITIEHVPKE